MQNVLEILVWYKNNLRELPWRVTKDPYKIWLSEVILQQTQVNQGLKYYHRFVEQYPDVQSLAIAEEQAVLKLWQGLGYYSRARNLLKTAQIITDQYHGVFPNSMAEIQKLPGIGQYTASAILSFAYNLPFPALDGNVFRVISRLYNLRLPINEQKNRSTFLEILNEMIVGVEPSDFNNAMMELGAMVCKPDNPKCDVCPVAHFCEAKKLGTARELPIKSAKVKKRNRFFQFFYIQYQNGFYLHKREGSDIWQNLYQLPLIETKEAVDTTDIFNTLQVVNNLIQSELLNAGPYQLAYVKTLKHVLTHQDIQAHFFKISLTEMPQFKASTFQWVDANSLQNYPLPILIENFILSL